MIDMTRLVCFAVLSIAACTPMPGPAPIPADADAAPQPTPDPSPPPIAADAYAPGPIDACEASYRHLVAIGCRPKGTAAGTPWQDVCRVGRENGVFALHCINVANTVAAANKCGVGCSGN